MNKSRKSRTKNNRKEDAVLNKVKIIILSLCLVLLILNLYEDFFILNYYKLGKARVSNVHYIYDDGTWTSLSYFLTVDGKEYFNKTKYDVGKNTRIAENDSVYVLYNPLFPSFSSVKLEVINDYFLIEK